MQLRTIDDNYCSSVILVVRTTGIGSNIREHVIYEADENTGNQKRIQVYFVIMCSAASRSHKHSQYWRQTRRLTQGASRNL